MAATPSIRVLGWKAADFALPGVDGKTWRLADIRGKNGTLVMFICNHCPDVKAVIGNIVRDAAELEGHGVRSIAIMPNDTIGYPEDSLDNMTVFARAHRLGFPYVVDESQGVACAYDAVCTPDFFGFDRNLGLQYRGRLDASKTTLVANARRDLFEAMIQIATTGKGPKDQIPSMGCSIKWRHD